MIILDPWGSADTIIKNNYRPNYVFRLSLTDTFAIEKLFSRAEERGFTRIGMMLPNTAWGRSNMAAAESYSASRRSVRIVRSRWYNWGDASLLPIYKDVREAGAEAVLLVANDLEGSILVNEVAGLPEEERAPILSHWGVTGGAFFQKTKDSLAKLDFEVVQTFSFFKADPEIRDRFMSLVNRLRPVESFERIEAPVGVGHAYDLTHLLALAIEKAGTVDRAAVRDALEDIGPYRGLTGFFPRPFTPENHDALSIDHVFMAKYRDDGVLVPITPETRP
jgi:branched-chain amino acid transport system substrate-binding protein